MTHIKILWQGSIVTVKLIRQQPDGKIIAELPNHRKILLNIEALTK